MNTVKSFWYGWGVLIAAGGGAYYFAKRSINEDRQARFDKDQQRRRMTSSLEYSNTDGAPRHSSAAQSAHDASQARSDVTGSQNWDASKENELSVATEKSKYEASQPYRSKKGDRFS
ncbi:hypothetical protein FGG08_003785 [Glutinoglossum americanum]|uniref:Uncharacterized protein n=1 Tax=Glutinoglossum americanum TaxID=1670608 RepID=A0A9P8L4G8_9PEZI|nr:hypothetical protein FGG08_003785 [Glutinoglossum americanum]